MADLKTFWDNPVFSGADLSSDVATGSGSDPNADGGQEGGNACAPIWSNPPVSNPGQAESENSVSGLPSLPNRYQPPDQPPPLPTLTDRRPGTIDKQ